MEFDLKKDLNFKLGRQYVVTGKFEDAVDTFSTLLQTSCSRYGDDSIQVAPIWFEYGNALLSKEEDSPTDELLGVAEDVAKEAIKQIQDEDAEEGNHDNADNDDEDEQDGEEKKTNDKDNAAAVTGDEEASDMEVAWEALEMARTILERNAGPDTDSMLAEVYSRLGDLQRFNCNYDAAIDEYKKCIDILECVCSERDRLLSTAYYNIAAAYLYNSAEEGHVVIDEKKKALDYYRKSKTIVDAIVGNHNISKPPTSISASATDDSATNTATATSDLSSAGNDLSEIAELERISEELEETIAELESDIKIATTTTTSSSSGGVGVTSSSSASTGVTTIGFGSSSSSSFSAVATSKPEASSSIFRVYRGTRPVFRCDNAAGEEKAKACPRVEQ